MRLDWYTDHHEMPFALAEGMAMLDLLWPRHDGPAHVILADFNFEEVFFESCIEGCGPGRDPLSDEYEDTNHPVYVATAAVLRWMQENTTEAERLAWLTTY